MWIGLLCIFGCYGVSIVMLHLLFGARKGTKKKPATILLVTKNNQNQIEWVIRSLFFFSRVKGNQVKQQLLMRVRPTIRERSLSVYPKRMRWSCVFSPIMMPLIVF